MVKEILSADNNLHTKINATFQESFCLKRLLIHSTCSLLSPNRNYYSGLKSSIEHGGTSSLFNMIEQFVSRGVPAHFTILWKNFLEQSDCTNEFGKVMVQEIEQTNLKSEQTLR